MGEGANQGDAWISACLGGTAHGLDKLRAAIGIDGVVSPVIGHHDVLQPAALRHADGHAEHDAIAEGNDRRAHVLIGIVAFGNRLVALQQRTLEVAVHEVERNDNVFDAQPLAVQPGEGNLTGVVV